MYYLLGFKILANSATHEEAADSLDSVSEVVKGKRQNDMNFQERSSSANIRCRDVRSRLSHSNLFRNMDERILIQVSGSTLLYMYRKKFIK